MIGGVNHSDNAALRHRVDADGGVMNHRQKRLHQERWLAMAFYTKSPLPMLAALTLLSTTTPVTPSLVPAAL